MQSVETAAHRRAFLVCPDQHYRGDPYYVRPNNQEIEAVFDPAKNKLFAGGGQATRWLLLDTKGHAVGRIAAFINPRIQAAEEVPVGGFGFFECPDDPVAARRLLDAARQWLTARGMQAMDGPINFGDRDRFWGLHVEGFDRLPSYAMFYHRLYYQELLENEGLHLYFRQYSYWMSASAPLAPRLHRLAETVTRKLLNVRYASASPNNPERLARDLHRVYSLAWGRHAGVGEMTLDQARALVKKMKAVLDYHIIWFAYDGDDAVAMLVALPGLNQIFHRTGPNLNWWGKLKFFLEKQRWERRTDKLANAVLYGVVPDFQGAGIDAALCVAAQPVFARAGYRDGELVWIGDFNPKMMAICRAVGGTICKTHHTYRQYFDPSRPFERLPIIGKKAKDDTTAPTAP
ncbi:MAG: hypothetical protein H7330_02030 [Hymenobacteraceae bacterium]|nr:hypothetical protein [Hymenobacteraceae bacterium]